MWSGFHRLGLVSIVVFFFICSAIATARQDFEEEIKTSMPLSSWLQQKLGLVQGATSLLSVDFDPYLPGLVWMNPTEMTAQDRSKLLLLEYLKAPKYYRGVSSDNAKGMIDFVASLPVTGRVVLEKTDPRWLEGNPKYDPILMVGQRIRIPSRPKTVAVLRGNGTTCFVTHHAQAYAADYLRQCDPVDSPKMVWVVQPDGIVQRRGVAAWNEVEQNPPAPGAWLVYSTASTPWPHALLDQLARLLATQGGAGEGVATNVLPAPDGEGEWFWKAGKRRPRDLPILSSNWGVTGLIQAPTARMNPAGEASATLVRTAPYRWMNVNLQPLDWFEATLRYVDIEDKAYGPSSFSGDQSYKDKSIDFKLLLRRESEWIPQFAVGVKDVGGTGLFSGEYLVASKRTGNFDWSLGMGWGYLGARGNLSNPLSILSSKFNTRTRSGEVTTGTVAFSTLFRGPVSLFGGMQYQSPWDAVVFKLEYDGNNYQHEPSNNTLPQNSPINFGISYRYSPGIDLSVNWERGNTLGLGLSFHGRLDRMFIPKINDPARVPVLPYYPTQEPDWVRVAAQLEQTTAWGVLQLRKAGSEIIVRFDRAEAQYWNAYIDRIASVLHRDVPGDVLLFRIQSSDRGLGIHEYLIDRRAWVHAKIGYMPEHKRSIPLFERPEEPGFVYPQVYSLVDREPKQLNGKIGLTYHQTLGGPDGFILYQIGWGALGSWYVRPDTWMTGAVRYRLIDNYEKFKLSSNSVLPNVRTRMREYMTTSEFTMPLMQMTHVRKLGNDQYLSVYGGMLESMFGGLGTEWLYRPWGSRIAVGVDVNAVKQRGYKQDFEFLDYGVLTGHVSLHLDTGVQGILTSVKMGKYLAGDLGVTLEMAREFSNGVKIGAFATKTNVSAAQFGEGSFDKGIYVDIPFDAILTRSSNTVAHMLWKPLTRDGGAILSRQHSLFDMTQYRSGKSLIWGRNESDRKRQFGDAPDEFPETVGRESAYSIFAQDLAGFGTELTENAFPRSLLYAGGITLFSALLDKPVDSIARRYGSSGMANGLETIGNALPFATLAISGVMALGEHDATLTKASMASLEAGATGLAVALGMKYTFGRARPEAGLGTGAFSPFKNRNTDSSFPSMHTAMAWASVTPYAKAYNAPWLYGVAALTNVSRISGRQHWLSDTVAGSLIGYGLGSYFWDARRQSRYMPSLFLKPGEVVLSWKTS